MDSSLCRGTMVTSSISQRKATSVGTRPGGRGSAMVKLVGSRRKRCDCSVYSLKVWDERECRCK